MSLDLALVREDAVSKSLKFKRLFVLTYSFFVPKRLAVGMRECDLKAKVAELPLATSVGGQFREQLTLAADKTGWSLRIELSCSSFTQAVGAVKTGEFVAALPDRAAVEFGPGEVVQYPIPFLKAYARPIGVAWNPRLVEVRPVVGKAVSALERVLGNANTAGARQLRGRRVGM